MKRISLFILVLLSSTQLFAQSRRSNTSIPLYNIDSPFQRYTHNIVTFRWGAAIPMGGLKEDYIDKSNFGNYSLALEWQLKNSPFSIGGDIGRNYFQKRIPRTLYTIGEEDISAVQTRTLKDVSVHAFTNYHFKGVDERIRPYVQLSVGPHFNNYTNYYGTLSEQEKKITFGLGLGGGARFLFTDNGNVGLDLSARYKHNFFKHDYITSPVSNINVSVGIFYRWW